ncbi:MAG TPA: hypothetical protein VLC91_09215 [Spongiibacteraceae bacterium]|nr:hypothetical protein [Spongiibacteraceae bacterium]
MNFGLSIVAGQAALGIVPVASIVLAAVMLPAFLTGLSSFFRGELVRRTARVRSFATFAAGSARFLRSKFMRFSLLMGGASSFGGYFALLCLIHRCKAPFTGIRSLIEFGCHKFLSIKHCVYASCFRRLF